MNVKHLDHLNLTVTDLDESIAWYHRVFAFEPVEEGQQGQTRWAIIRSGEALLALYEHPGRHVADDDEARVGRIHQLNHFGLRITDRAAWERTAADNALTWSYPSPVAWPHSTAWYVLDPSGHEIEVALWEEDRIAFS